MSTPIRRELELARLAARERRLRLVIQILNVRRAEHQRASEPTPPGLRHSIADFGTQLSEVHRRQADLGGRREGGSTPMDAIGPV